MRVSRVVLATLCLSTGCADLESGKNDLAPASSSDGGPVGTEDPNGAETPDLELEPAFFTIEGVIAIGDDTPRHDASALEIAWWSADGDLVCAVEPVLTSIATRVSPDPEVPLLSWWQITIEPFETCQGLPGPEQLALGIGAYDSLLDPAVAGAGLDDAVTYGLYIQPRVDGPVWVYGVAEPTRTSGDAEPAQEPPLPDGAYALVALHLLPLP